MNSLVGYASSDEDDVDVQPERPAKIAKLAIEDSTLSKKIEAATTEQNAKPMTEPELPAPQQIPDFQPGSGATAIGPAQGPSLPQPVAHQSPNSDSTAPSTPTAPLSPYSAIRQRTHELTMPQNPDFSIPDSPPRSTSPTRAAQLKASTAKFEKFLTLKRTQDVHFNARLRDSVALRNPALLSTLFEFAGVSDADSRRSTLDPQPGGGGVPVEWPDSWYANRLVKENERRSRASEKERGKAGQRTKVDFVAERAHSTGGHLSHPR